MLTPNEAFNKLSNLENTLLVMTAQLDALLEHCPDAECSVCAKIICPHGCEMHFHHDGCPACAEHDNPSR